MIAAHQRLQAFRHRVPPTATRNPQECFFSLSQFHSVVSQRLLTDLPLTSTGLSSIESAQPLAQNRQSSTGFLTMLLFVLPIHYQNPYTGLSLYPIFRAPYP